MQPPQPIEDQELAWRLFAKGVDVSRERHRITTTGDERLTEPLLRAVAIIA